MNHAPLTLPADNLLSRLDGLKDRGNGTYLARCPAHDDRNPSLSVKETQDGTLLVKCWSGCSALSIVNAVGLELKDLFPHKDIPHHKGKKPRWNPRDLLAVLNREITIAVIAAGDLARGEELSEHDRERLYKAYQRLSNILGESNALA